MTVMTNDRDLQGKHALVFTLINSLCISHTGIRLSSDSMIRECWASRWSYRKYQLSQSPRVCSECSNCTRKFSRLISFTRRGLIDLVEKATRAQAKISIAHRIDVAASNRLRNIARILSTSLLPENIITHMCYYILKHIKSRMKFWSYVGDFNDWKFTVYILFMTLISRDDLRIYVTRTTYWSSSDNALWVCHADTH